MAKKKHGSQKLYPYVGTKSDKFVRGEYYTYAEISEITGLGISTLRTRLGCVEGKVITDDVIAPKRKPFTHADGTLFVQNRQRIFPDKLETESEKMMDKYLRMPL